MPTNEEAIKIQNAIITLQTAGFEYDGIECHEREVIYAFRMRFDGAPCCRNLHHGKNSPMLFLMKLTYERLMQESALYAPPTVNEVMKAWSSASVMRAPPTVKEVMMISAAAAAEVMKAADKRDRVSKNAIRRLRRRLSAPTHCNVAHRVNLRAAESFTRASLHHRPDHNQL